MVWWDAFTEFFGESASTLDEALVRIVLEHQERYFAFRRMVDRSGEKISTAYEIAGVRHSVVS